MLQEIEEKAPVLLQQKRDYEQALQSVDKLTKRLDLALIVSWTDYLNELSKQLTAKFSVPVKI